MLNQTRQGYTARPCLKIGKDIHTCIHTNIRTNNMSVIPGHGTWKQGSKVQGYPQLDNELEVSLDNGLLPCKDM